MPYFVLKAYPSYSRCTDDDGSIARAAFFFYPQKMRVFWAEEGGVTAFLRNDANENFLIHKRKNVSLWYIPKRNEAILRFENNSNQPHDVILLTFPAVF